MRAKREEIAFSLQPTTSSRRKTFKKDRFFEKNFSPSQKNANPQPVIERSGGAAFQAPSQNPSQTPLAPSPIFFCPLCVAKPQSPSRLPRMIQFRFLGIPVTVQPFHWVILALIGFQMTGGANRSGLLLLALFVLAGFVSILIHEMGHALTGRKFGAQPEVILHGFGGVAIFPYARFTRLQSFMMTAAGPGIQLILGGLAFLVLLYGNLPPTHITNFFTYLMFVSIFWAVINCVPVWPLDGGQMMAAILGDRRVVLMHQISIAVAIVSGLLMFFYLGSFIFPIFMGFAAYQNYQALQQYKNNWR